MQDIGLLIIDMQMGMGRRLAERKPVANPDAEANVATLCTLFRGKGLPVFHIHHVDPTNDFATDGAGFPPLPCAVPADGEQAFRKTGSSGFSGTGLDRALRQEGVRRLVVVGAVAAYCVTTTVRDACDLGFDVVLPGDALIAFDVAGHDSGVIPSDEVLRVTLSLLGSDFARLVATDEVAGIL